RYSVSAPPRLPVSPLSPSTPLFRSQAPRAVVALLVATGLDPATQVRVGAGHASLRVLLARSHLPDASELRGLDAQSVASRLQPLDRKSTRLNSSHVTISYAVFCLKR